jgi:hypothetical protein
MLLGALAVFVGASIAGHGHLTIVLLPAIAGALALLGGISRPLALASGRILPLIVIASGLEGVHARPGGAALLFVLGSAWTILVSVTLHRIIAAGSQVIEPIPEPKVVPWRYLVRRWRGTLRTLEGWRFTLRLVPCLLVSEVVALHWGRGHGHWISLTVVLVVQRDLSSALARTLQRAVGTLVGVILGGAFMALGPSAWGSVVAIGVLAAARPVLRSGNYMVYSVAMTPLVILLLDLGAQDLASSLIDRLLATLVGCALALVLGFFPWSRRAARQTVA